MRATTVLCAALLALTIGVFVQTANHQFISFDDPLYVTNNPHVKGGITGESILWAFTTITASNWHPLTWLSHMADVQLYGVRPRGHHLTNVLIHTATTLLLFLFLVQITSAPWQSLFVAALFALHPLHVESVAWVAERKDVLSGFLWVLTLLLYAGYVEHPSLRRYLAILLSFVAGLMAKPMLVSLPVVMLLLDYWPLHRVNLEQSADGTKSKPMLFSLIREKIPFFLLAAASALVTMYAQNKGGALKSLDTASFGLRGGNAAIAYIKYLWKTIWPHDLAVLYPFPSSIPVWEAICSFLVLISVSTAAICYRRRHPYLLVGWFWFLITLAPVIGLIQVGGQSMADRYTYVPLIGLFIMCTWLMADVMRGRRYRQTILAAVAGVLLLALTLATWHQLSYWNDNISLYQRTLQVTTGNYLIRNNYGIALADQGRLDEAILLYGEALQIWPKSATAHVNWGAALANQGKFLEAIDHYQKAIELIPDYALAYGNLGRALASIGRTEEAIVTYQEALRLDPNFSDIHLNLAILLLKAGQRDASMKHYEAVLQLDPYSVKAPINMGAALAQEGMLEDAVRCFNQALLIDSQSIEAHFNLGMALAKQKRTEKAVQQFLYVLRLRPDLEPARRWLENLEQKKDPLP